MFDSEFYFLLPPAVPQEVELPEAFDRVVTPAKKPRRESKKAPPTASGLIAEFLSEAKSERGLSAYALQILQSDLEMYWRWLQARGVVKLRAVSASLVEKYAHDLRCGQTQGLAATRQRPALNAKFWAATTVARKIAAVREWHRFLARRYKWPDPAALLPDTSLAPPSSLALSAEQIKTLLTAPNVSTVLGLRDQAVLCLLCEGVSPQEIGALRQEESEAELPYGETARRAVQAYIARARPILLARLRKKGLYSRRVFFSNRGAPLSPLLMQQIVRRYVKGAQLPSWVSASQLHKSGAARRERGADLNEDSGMEVAALPRVAQLRHAYSKAHPRA